MSLLFRLKTANRNSKALLLSPREYILVKKYGTKKENIQNELNINFLEFLFIMLFVSIFTSLIFDSEIF